MQTEANYLMKQGWLRISEISIIENPDYRIVHVSDIHYDGNESRFTNLISRIMVQEPDFACFTGDLISSARYETKALEILGNLTVPLYGVPGNWDYMKNLDFQAAAKCFDATGGKWLIDETVEASGGSLVIAGAVGKETSWIPPDDSRKRLLLVHYPKFVRRLGDRRFDLILSGHSHGGQVRLPLIGSLLVPFGVGRYDLGLFRTPNGPLYVTSGFGTSAFPLRLNCPPEIAVIEF